MERVLHANEATITTATIEVKVMRIGTKQVTLAVFKQLPEKQIIDYATGELQGEPWGIVNYHPGCDKEMVSHFHVVWQKGGILYRAAIEELWKHSILPEILSWDGGNPVYELDYYIESFFLARLLEGWVIDSPKRKALVVSIEDERFSLSLEDVSTILTDALNTTYNHKELLKNCQQCEQTYKENPDNSFYAKTLSLAHDRCQGKAQEWEGVQQGIIQTLKEERGLPIDSNTLYHQHLIPARLALHRFKQTWQQSYAQLEQLGQLFIAV